MDSAELRAAEDALFVRWKAELSATGKAFLPDGAMPDFAAQEFRIVFVLKEGNDATSEWTLEHGGDLRQAWEWPGTERGRTWNVAIRMAASILSDKANGEAPDLSEPEMIATLRRIAWVNLKKDPGGSRTAIGPIRTAALRDAQFIRDQLRLYRPNLIIAGGTLWPLGEVFRLPDSDRFGFKFGDGCDQHFLKIPGLGLVMDFWHPGSRSPSDKVRFKHLAECMAFIRREGLLKGR